jgi:glycosyltransferase involved in cell wall biosynthesis
MKVHVCVDGRLITQTGIGTFLRSTLTAISHATAYELTILCREDEQDILQSFSSNLIVMHSAIYTVKEQAEYRKTIPSCDLFWSPHFNVPLLPVKAKKKVSVICDVYHLAHFSSLNLSQKIYAKIVYNAAFYLSDTVVTISEFSKNEILKYASLKPKKLVVACPPLDFAPPAGNFEKQKFLLYVGNLKPHKNLVRLVKAYSLVRPEEKLVIVGKKEGLLTADAALFKEVEKDPFLKKNVLFTGYIEEKKIKELYASAFLFLFLSTYEGYGYPPLEAMVCNCPVVAAKAASIPEVCQDAVEYVDPYSVVSIADGIKKLLYDTKRREELMRKGKELIEKKQKRKNNIVDIIDACCNRT